ncbi:MAG: FAD-dependent oxidoreductase [Planctomycetaceae bacterium]|nr:FAD-dependent oxidoreductase [Planctomycetaceae bacterium]
MESHQQTVAIIGAGIAGLTCARELAAGGFDVTLFDKGRLPGGRTATRRVDPGCEFDHGAQYFTARDSRFQKVTADWMRRGVVAEWHGRIVRLEDGVVSETTPLPRYVGTPGMSAMAADLAAGLHVHSGIQVVRVNRDAAGWKVTTATQEIHGPFHTLVVTLPSPQTAVLLEDHPFAALAAAIPMTPCWAIMVAFDSKIELPWDGAFVHSSPLSWVARNSSKPGRNRPLDAWVLHASADWSMAHLEQSPEEAAPQLLAAFEDIVGRLLPSSHFLQAHRWRYSLGSDPAERKTLVDRENRLIVCGDWLSGGRVEGAFLSGIDAACRMVNL